MANPIYGRNTGGNGRHLVWDGGILTHEALSRIIPFLFDKIGIGDEVTDADCKMIARQIRNWARHQETWINEVDTAFFRYGITAFMPPFIEKLVKNADTIDAVVPGMKREIWEIYTKLNFSTFSTRPKRRGKDGIKVVDPKEVFAEMLAMAEFFDKSGGIIPEDLAGDDDNRADFIAFMNEKGNSIPAGDIVDAFIDQEVRPIHGEETEYIDYLKGLLGPVVGSRKKAGGD